jgi:hypothetical protein
MRKWIENWVNWVMREEARDLERYLAQSANISDLERRMREWEKRQATRGYLS